jgi:hypothetical protein
MTADFYWASPQFEILLNHEVPDHARLVAVGDFSGAGGAVLRGALSRVAHMPFPVVVDTSAVTALSADAAQALTEQTARSMRRHRVQPRPPRRAAG